MLLNLHHFAYFITCYDIICYVYYLVRDILLFFLIYMDSLRVIFYDFDCRFIRCKVSGAEFYAP
jgi:hypothetical protein